MSLNNFEIILHKVINYNLLKASIPFFLLFIILEIIFLGFHQTKIRFNNTINNISAGLIQQLSGILVLNSITLITYIKIQNIVSFLNFELFNVQQKILMLFLLFFLVDFCYYLFHMFSHKINIFWAAHIVHHQSEDYNLSTALRQSSFQVCYSWIFYVPIAVIGYPFKWFITMKSINLVYQFWIHTECIKKLPKYIEFFFNTPSHHRVHHGSNSKYLDKNHGGILIIWDRIFGSFQEEEEKVNYGITTGLQSWNPIWAQCHYFFEIYQMSKKLNSFSHKIKIWIKQPGWAETHLKKTEAKNKVHHHKKYNPKIDHKSKYLAFLLFFISLICSYMFLNHSNDHKMRILLAISMLVLLYLTGKILEKGINYKKKSHLLRDT